MGLIQTTKSLQNRMVPMHGRGYQLEQPMLCVAGRAAAVHTSGDRASVPHRFTRKPSMPFHVSSPYLLPVILLICSNLFMTVAWYGHLRFKAVPLAGVILVSWGIAFIEYCFAVPANRFGNAVYSAAQLKTMQEVITLLVFAGFSLVYLKEPIGWNHLVGFALISAGAFFIFQKW
jgi:uncharacterized protein (DUF486 family)